MAAVSRALDRVAKLHALELDDVHLPFAGEAVTRSGHPLPQSTRSGYRDADAILVASPGAPALEGVKADLQLAWRVARIQVGDGRDVVVAGPVGEWADAIALRNAFRSAAARRGMVVTVGDSESWRADVKAERERWSGLQVEEVSMGDALERVREEPETVDVIVTESHLVSVFVETVAHVAGSRSSVAQAWLPDHGPGLFVPGSSQPEDVAGFGVADPKGMFLTASLMLAEGLKRRSASRTLERAVEAASRQDASRDTQSFTDAVIELLPAARTDVDHFQESIR
jgi:isocitrate/isopropylmalate dehydrogenase